MIDEETAELYVLYLGPNRKREGIGGKLLEAITKDQTNAGQKDNGCPFSKTTLWAFPFMKRSVLSTKASGPPMNFRKKKALFHTKI